LVLQNRDGGWPTFCRGWGRLPFDRSGTDLTAHALSAFYAWEETFFDERNRYYPPINWRKNIGKRLAASATTRGLHYLTDTQHADGSWSPLWFGNQDHPTEDNPVYGTAKVLMAYRDLDLMNSPEAKRGVDWLITNQNEDGGWGSGVWQMRNAEFGMQSNGDGTQQPSPEPRAPSPLFANPQSPIPNLKSSIEETALAVEALLAANPPSPEPRTPNPSRSAVEKGLNWLMDRVESGQHRQPAPIGFYFAKLWYYERLYPLTFTVAALGRACRQFDCQKSVSSPAISAETAPSDAQ
jgi:squalene-hopene/tetraprenyl-beta-curcumene cyclase